MMLIQKSAATRTRHVNRLKDWNFQFEDRKFLFLFFSCLKKQNEEEEKLKKQIEKDLQQLDKMKKAWENVLDCPICQIPMEAVLVINLNHFKPEKRLLIQKTEKIFKILLDILFSIFGL